MDNSGLDPPAPTNAQAQQAVPEPAHDLTTKASETLDGVNKSEDPTVISPSSSAKSIPVTAQDILDRALRFLSTASNETVGACLIGLAATTYLVLGRVGLVIMGAAGGVILHAAWEDRPADDASRVAEEKRRKEIGLDIIHRVLEGRNTNKGTKSAGDTNNTSTRVEVFAKRKLDFTGFRSETKAALEELTDAVIRDYVNWWYSPILPSESTFPAACRQVLTSFLLGISQHMARKRPADTFLEFLTHSSSIVTVFLTELAAATSAAPTASVSDAIRIYLDQKPDSSLATIVDTTNQEAKLNLVAEDILECYLDSKAYNCEPVRVFLQQMLARVCIEMTIDSCSKPEFINDWIVYLLEESEPDIMKGLGAEVGGAVQKAPAQVGEHVPVTETSKEVAEKQREAQHKRTVSKAQEAMEEAMKEAQRLSQMIAEHDAERQRTEPSGDQASSSEVDSAKRRTDSTRSENNAEPALATSVASIKTDVTESTTHGMYTPTSSQAQSEHDLNSGDKLESARSSAEALNDEQGEEQPPGLPPRAFTNFDQLIPAQSAVEDFEGGNKDPPPLTLHQARISIFDDSDPNDRKAIRQKPQSDYMIQIEPASSHHLGWMVFRKYADFENLHFVLGRIARIAGAAVFAEAHSELPTWKGTTETKLREALERYLVDAVRFQSLAESEGMKRFLEKDQAVSKSPNPKAGFGWPTPTAFETMGKGMLDALAKAPKEVAGGGKAIIGGVTGVFTGGKPKKPSISTPAGSPAPLTRRTSTTPSIASSRPSTTIERSQSNLSLTNSAPRPSQDVLRTPSPIIDTQPALIPQMDSRPPSQPETPSEPKPPARLDPGTVVALGGDQFVQLPPPPSEIADDYDSNIGLRTSTSSSNARPKPADPSSSTASLAAPATHPAPPASDADTAAPAAHAPLTEQETTLAVTLLFAPTTTLYALPRNSPGTWSAPLRLTLLNAAKAFLLRPGNPQLASIGTLLQTAVLDANSSDAGVAALLRKLRANALPTEDEARAWPAELTAAEKVALRDRARRVLVERGLPTALVGVMGQAASAEALGRVFDALQVKRVARGLVFGLVLQGLRAVTQ